MNDESFDLCWSALLDRKSFRFRLSIEKQMSFCWWQSIKKWSLKEKTKYIRSPLIYYPYGSKRTYGLRKGRCSCWSLVDIDTCAASWKEWLGAQSMWLKWKIQILTWVSDVELSRSRSHGREKQNEYFLSTSSMKENWIKNHNVQRPWDNPTAFLEQWRRFTLQFSIYNRHSFR